ncbi:MAG TPA: metallophosphoesterase [Symbiobacteriaceae bacterium]|nr:metallophosphoesterase [Symbiobacteriaceae bacterium]
MAVYALGDTHLGFAVNKPMDIFGPLWARHPAPLFQNWEATVAPDDIVLVPGDISWGMTLQEAAPDLTELDALPGRKLLIQGNHDYWWESLRKMRELSLKRIEFIQNDAVLLPPGTVSGVDGPVAVCGTRGWITPGDRTWGEDEPHNAKIYAREAGRLKMSLDAGRKAGAAAYIAMLHYPPVAEDHQPTAFTDVLQSYGSVLLCVYGHLHGAGSKYRAFQGEHGGVRYLLTACDAIDFTPVRVF